MTGRFNRYGMQAATAPQPRSASVREPPVMSTGAGGSGVPGRRQRARGGRRPGPVGARAVHPEADGMAARMAVRGGGAMGSGAAHGDPHGHPFGVCMYSSVNERHRPSSAKG